MHSLKTISLIIPTYNRAEDLKATLKSLKLFFKNIYEIIVIDQSTDNKTKLLVNSLRNRKIKYFYSKIPSITIARNLGIKKSSSKTEIICFIDDDVTIKDGYFEEILKIFNNHAEAKAVAGYIPSPEFKRISFFELISRKIFFLSYPEKDKARIISAYGNTYPDILEKTINSEWLPGVNMAYKKEIFKEQLFDENFLGYTVGEDIDFTYSLYKKYPRSLFITQRAKLVHRVSLIERYPTEKMSYINQVDHFYFHLKNMNDSFIKKVVFFWSLTGISIMRPIKFLLSRNETDYLKMKFFFTSLLYCLINIKKIKEGKLRDFISNKFSYG